MIWFAPLQQSVGEISMKVEEEEGEEEGDTPEEEDLVAGGPSTSEERPPVREHSIPVDPCLDVFLPCPGLHLNFPLVDLPADQETVAVLQC